MTKTPEKFFTAPTVQIYAAANCKKRAEVATT